jgi:predicted metal-dependent phosphoesterase TrpH
MGWVDLHLHTTASDGVMTPSAIVRYAKTKGLQAIAITDHDTVGGVSEAVSAGSEIDFEVIPGIEISAEHSPGSMHLLGYFLDIDHPLLTERLRFLQMARAERNPKIVEKLNRLGVRICYDEVVKASGGGQVGRPHFAQVLLEKGYVRTFQEAFERFLTKGAPAYVDKARFSPQDALALIRKAGGVPVLAHPNTLDVKGHAELERLVAGLVDQGLEGIEVYYPEHTPLQTAEYRVLAERYCLLVTGGTDYHGIAGDGLDIGTGRGEMRLPYSMVETLRKAHERILEKETS